MNNPFTVDRSHSITDWGIPAPMDLVAELEMLADQQPLVRRAIDSLQTREIRDDHFPTEFHGGVVHPVEQVALLARLAAVCGSNLSLEVGFGMGTTATVITAARASTGRPFRHIVFDPYGLSDGRGQIARSGLAQTYGDSFELIREPSQFGMGKLVLSDDKPGCDLIFIDGSHLVDAVFSDFYAADQLLNPRGFMVFDDARSPAVETVIQFIMHNRADYLVSHLEIENTAVAMRIDQDVRSWEHFRPFPVPDRLDWDFR